MDLVCSADRNGAGMKLLSKQNGQSVVEYVMLLAVISFLAATIFRSPLFTDFFGDNSNFFNALKDRMEYSYRFTHSGIEDNAGRAVLAPSDHYSYRKDNGSRFAGATTPY